MLKYDHRTAARVVFRSAATMKHYARGGKEMEKHVSELNPNETYTTYDDYGNLVSATGAELARREAEEQESED